MLTPLCINTNSVKRLVNDYNNYLVEAEKQEKRINELREKEADEAKIRKQIEVLEETKQMFPDVKNRLAIACQTLQGQLNSENANVDEVKKAQAALEEASKIQ